MKRTLYINFVLACTTAFILLAMYSLDYASEGYTVEQRRAYEQLHNEVLSQGSGLTSQQVAFLREWNQ